MNFVPVFCFSQMRVSAAVSLALIGFVLMAAPPAETDRNADRIIAGLGAGFRESHTGHFMLAYDTSDQVAEGLLSRLEETYGAVLAFCDHAKLSYRSPAAPLVTILFNRQEGYEKFRLMVNLPIDESAGAFLPTLNLAAFWNVHNHVEIQRITEQIERLAQNAGESHHTSLDHERELERKTVSLRSQRDALVRSFNGLVVAHETAHQVFHNVGAGWLAGDGPAWLTEGLACQFEIPQPRLTDGVLAINPMRYADFRAAWGIEPNVRAVTDAQYRKAIQSGRTVRLSELLASARLLTDDVERSAFRYAQAWALVYYLHERHRVSLTEFLRAAAAQAAPTPTIAGGLFENAFGPTDQRWEIAMVSYVLSRVAAQSGP